MTLYFATYCQCLLCGSGFCAAVLPEALGGALISAHEQGMGMMHHKTSASAHHAAIAGADFTVPNTA